MSRVYNFSAGPAALPSAVLEQAREYLLEWGGLGASVMEISHRGAPFMAVAEQAESDLRGLLEIPNNYKVLFLQGGAYGQFSLVPLNLLGQCDKPTVDYIDTGIWSCKAIEVAAAYAQVNVAASSQAQNYSCIPNQQDWQLNPQAHYVHYTPNETINGVEFHFIPETHDVPLVADMSSTILSRPIDISRFGVIYAGAQKNIGPSGLVLVIVRDDLLARAHPHTPAAFNYSLQAAAGSMLNTPPTFSWYLSGLVFKWLKEQGGLSVIAEHNQAKATLLYKTIDQSGFYSNTINHADRSWMNVPFTLPNLDLERAFLAAANDNGLIHLAGHRSVGGVRASIYNAMPLEGVMALTDFMIDFAAQHGH